MTFRSLRRFSAFALLLGAALASATPAHATLAIRVSSGATTTDFFGAAGSVSTGGATTAGNFTVSANGFSKPILGSATAATMDLSTISVGTSSGGTLTVILSDTDFRLTGLPGLATIMGQLTNNVIAQGAGVFATVAMQVWANADNGLFSMTGMSTAINQMTGSFVAQLPPKTGSLTNPFSLTLQLTFKSNGAFQFSTDGNTTVTSAPEPTTMAAALLGLPLAYLKLRSRRRKV